MVQVWPKTCSNIVLSAVSWFTILVTPSMCREVDTFVFMLYYSLNNVPLKISLFAPFSCSCIHLVSVVWNTKYSTALGKWESRIKQWFPRRKNLVLIHCFQEFHVGNTFFLRCQEYAKLTAHQPQQARLPSHCFHEIQYKVLYKNFLIGEKGSCEPLTPLNAEVAKFIDCSVKGFWNLNSWKQEKNPNWFCLQLKMKVIGYKSEFAACSRCILIFGISKSRIIE